MLTRIVEQKYFFSEVCKFRTSLERLLQIASTEKSNFDSYGQSISKTRYIYLRF